MAQVPLMLPSRRSRNLLVRPLGRLASTGYGLVAGVITAAFYFMNSGRSLDFDSSVTVGAFVKTPALIDPLRRQIALNNHPLFSLLEHCVWSMGFHTETALRALPIAFGCLTVALLTGGCARLWGLLPGACAGAVLAVNPLFAGLSRQVRGYSLLTLCALASTLLLWRLLAAAPAHVVVHVAYVGFLAAGISTHLYGCTVVLVHAAIVVGRGTLSWRWVRRWIAGLVLGTLIYLKTIRNVMHAHGARRFQGGFGKQVAEGLLGQAHVAVVILGVLVLCALWFLRGRRDLLAGAVATAAFVAFIWLVIQPTFLVDRYLVWLVPPIALAIGYVVARRPVVVVLVIVAVIGIVAHDSRTWTAVEVPTSETAAVVDAARAKGLSVCGIGHTGVAVLAYTRQPARALTFVQLARCQVAVGFYLSHSVRRFERVQFPYAWIIPGTVRAFVYSRVPQAVVEAGMTRTRDTLETHPRTWPS